MKIFLILSFIIFFGHLASAQTENEIRDMVVSMSDFSEKKLTVRDLPEITRQLKNIIILENLDMTRSGPFELKKSYPRYKALYKKSIETFSIDDQKTLIEVLNLVEALAKNGNG